MGSYEFLPFFLHYPTLTFIFLATDFKFFLILLVFTHMVVFLCISLDIHIRFPQCLINNVHKPK